MLEVVSCIGGALILFVALTLWANNGRAKSDHETEIV
jgi:hypothetical protein